MTQIKRILTLDWETRWARKPCSWSATPYTLTTMTTEEYIRDSRFKAFGLCVHELNSDTPTKWYSGKNIDKFFATVDWSTTAVLAHNAMFDVGILTMRYGIRPAMVIDSLSMARSLRGAHGGNSLFILAREFGLPPKGDAVYNTDGVYELTPEMEEELSEYCAHDVWLTEQIYKRLRLLPNGYKFPTSEMRLIDLTIRMFTDPVLELDVSMLEKAIKEDEAKLAAVLERAGVSEASLASNPQFAEVLRGLGVEPPVKKSKTTGKDTFAFAKNDAMFQAMLNGDNEEVALLCEARLRVKSTLERTRAKRFIDIAGRGCLPIPLYYYGAHSGRWSATGKINMQNMKRGSFLRMSICAPEGQAIVVGDLSQIEPRVLAWLSDYVEMLDTFRSGADPYATFGAQMFGIPGMTKESHPLLRQSAKSALLGCGYQLGWASFAGQLLVGFLGAPPQRYTVQDAKQLGVTRKDVHDFQNYEPFMEAMREIPHTCSEAELLIHCVCARAIVQKYRAAAEPVTNFWKLLGELLVYSLLDGNEFEYKCLKFRKGEIELPNGMCLRYPDIKVEYDAKNRPSYTYWDGKKRVRLYAGKLANNVTQALARIIMTDGMLRAAKRYRPLFTVHDEFGVLAPESEAKEARDFIESTMTQVPVWMPGIPLASDVGTAKRYGLVK